MAHFYNPLIRKSSTNSLEGSPSSLDYAIYPSPDRYRQNSFGLGVPLKNNIQNYFNQNLINKQDLLLNASTSKNIQDSNLVLNSINLNNQELWDELNTSESTISQNILYPNCLQQNPNEIKLQQKSVMVYGSVTPISPNHNKLVTANNLIGALPNTKLVDSTNLISDINSPAFKENIDIIQQSEYLNNLNTIDRNVLALTSALPDLKTINNDKLSLLANSTNSNNAELLAANTLLCPKSNQSTSSLLNDVVLMQPENYSNEISEQVKSTPMATPDMTSFNPSNITTTINPQNYQKLNTFFSPDLSPPAISQIYPSNVLTNPPNAISTVEGYRNVINSTVKSNSVPLVKTTFNKKISKNSHPSYVTKKLRSVNPLVIKSNILNKNQNLTSQIIENEKNTQEQKPLELQNISASKKEAKEDVLTLNPQLQFQKLQLKQFQKLQQLQLQQQNLMLNDQPLKNNSLPTPISANDVSQKLDLGMSKLDNIKIKEEQAAMEKDIKVNGLSENSEDNKTKTKLLKMEIDEKEELKVNLPKEETIESKKINNNLKNDEIKTEKTENLEINMKKDNKAEKIVTPLKDKKNFSSSKELPSPVSSTTEDKMEVDQKEVKDTTTKISTTKSSLSESTKEPVTLKEEKKETVSADTNKNKTSDESKKDEPKKKDEKEKLNKKVKETKTTSPASKDKTENISKDNKEKTNTTEKKETDIQKEEASSSSKKDETKDLLSVNTPPKIKKKTRFSLKSIKNDPKAMEEHILLKRRRNTEAARRSRQRKVQQMKNLEEAVQRLTKELEEKNNELETLKEKYESVVEELNLLKEKYENK